MPDLDEMDNILDTIEAESREFHDQITGTPSPSGGQPKGEGSEETPAPAPKPEPKPKPAPAAKEEEEEEEEYEPVEVTSEDEEEDEDESPADDKETPPVTTPAEEPAPQPEANIARAPADKLYPGQTQIIQNHQKGWEDRAKSLRPRFEALQQKEVNDILSAAELREYITLGDQIDTADRNANAYRELGQRVGGALDEFNAAVREDPGLKDCAEAFYQLKLRGSLDTLQPRPGSSVEDAKMLTTLRNAMIRQAQVLLDKEQGRKPISTKPPAPAPSTGPKAAGRARPQPTAPKRKSGNAETSKGFAELGCKYLSAAFSPKEK